MQIPASRWWTDTPAVLRAALVSFPPRFSVWSQPILSSAFSNLLFFFLRLNLCRLFSSKFISLVSLETFYSAYFFIVFLSPVLFLFFLVSPNVFIYFFFFLSVSHSVVGFLQIFSVSFLFLLFFRFSLLHRLNASALILLCNWILCYFLRLPTIINA